MNVDKLLLWEKWRPKKLEDIILPPRIREHFKSTITGNYIFYGSYGTGKTSLARILIGKYSGGAYLELNSSLYTSIDVLRGDIENFCKFQPMLETNGDIKYIFLDEFDRVSPQFQDAFKAFIEKYSKNVRFIITTNHINKITDGIKSRIPQLNFDPLDTAEEKYLKREIFNRIKNDILPSEGVSIAKEKLALIIKKKFPDFRSILVEVQNFIKTGRDEVGQSPSDAIRLELYSVLYSTNLDYEKIYHFVMNNFGPEKIDLLIKFLGKPFIDWAIEGSRSIDKLFECNYIISDYSQKLETSTDPIILGMTVIGKFRDLLSK